MPCDSDVSPRVLPPVASPFCGIPEVSFHRLRFLSVINRETVSSGKSSWTGPDLEGLPEHLTATLPDSLRGSLQSREAFSPGWGMDKRWGVATLMSCPPRLQLLIMKANILTFIIHLAIFQAGFAEPLYTQQGSDPSFEEVLQDGKLPRGTNSKTGVTGSDIDVKNELVELTPKAKRPIHKAIKIHTLGNSVIPRGDFQKWSRWYQEDGSTQVFRLFKGEVNVRNNRENAARIEAFSDMNWQHGAWHEWSGTYTIIKPHGAAIFQVKNNINDWAMQLNANSKGDVTLNHRQAEDKLIATGMLGKPFHIRVRDNGQDYEVYLDGRKVGQGSYARPKGTTAFRWGMYVGKATVVGDAMIFVSGATVDGKEEK